LKKQETGLWPKENR